MEVDTLVVGSGVAAAALSQRLLEKNPAASILLLEAGTRVKTRDFGLWEQYLVTGNLPYDRFKDLNYPQRDAPGENASVGGTEVPLMGARVLAYGGSTLHWGGWAFRLKPEDFCLWSNTGVGADWPIEYTDLEPYYCQAEDYLAVSGDSADTSVPRSARYPYSAFPFSLEDQPVAGALQKLKLGFGNLPIARRGVSQEPSRHAPCQTTGTCKYCPFGARYVASDYLDDVRSWNDYPNFNIRLGAIVEMIRMETKRIAAGVIFRDKASGESIEVNARRVIIAAGAIESAKLLLRSISPLWPVGVGNDQDKVGRHLVTHPYFIFTGLNKGNPLKLQPEMNFPTLVCRHFDSAEEQASGKFILVNPPDTVPVAIASKMQAGFGRKEIADYLTGPRPVQLHGMIEVFGRPGNRITNLDRRNQLGMVETTVDYTKDPNFDRRITDIQTHVEGIYAAMEAELHDKPTISWRADHAASVCRMSASEQDGVLDHNLRIHGVDNLYVCSNAAFPSIGAINPTLTLTALALRLGDHLGPGGA